MPVGKSCLFYLLAQVGASGSIYRRSCGLQHLPMCETVHGVIAKSTELSSLRQPEAVAPRNKSTVYQEKGVACMCPAVI